MMLVKYRFLSLIILGIAVLNGHFNIIPPVFLNTVATAQASDLTNLTIKTPDGGVYTVVVGESFLPRAVIKTHTPWTEGLQKFSGVPLKTLLETAGFDEKTVRQSVINARALNDYTVEIPGADAYEYDVLVADKLNGQAMPVTQFGPFWIVYPRDDKPELQDSRFDHRWAWQLSELLVE